MHVCMFAEIFGTTFRRLRKDAKLSQQEIATRGGFDRSYVTLIELGKKNPTMSVMEKMILIVSPSLSDFFKEFNKDLSASCVAKRNAGMCPMTLKESAGDVVAPRFQDGVCADGQPRL